MFKWIFWGVFAAILGAFLHYTLPQRDIVVITGTEIIRQDISGLNSWFYSGPDSGNAASENRDLRLINTIDANGRTRVYRNEDTGIGWPPYFKFDSADVQADAQASISTVADPNWVAVRHYGWRSTVISIYPNATSLTPVESPDTMLIPWFNIVVVLFLIAVVRAVQVRVARFWRSKFGDAAA